MSSKHNSRFYRKVWEKHNNACILPGMHVHHIDGNPENNDPKNLLVCTPEEHWKIHYEQGDTVALHGKFIQHARHHGEDHYRFGKSVDQSVRDKISRTLKHKYHQDPKNAIKHSRERGGKPVFVYKAKLISKAHGGVNWGVKSKKAVYKPIEFVGRFETQVEAAKALNLNKPHLNSCLKRKYGRTTHKGYMFFYEKVDGIKGSL